ncbi:MAG: hypothetical protein ACTHMV_11135 [Chitinophagaceae bacterium]
MKTTWKNIISGLLLLSLFSLAACSKDKKEDTPPPVVEKQLVVTASKTAVPEGSTVYFTIQADGQEETGATLSVNGTAISGTSHQFSTAGEYKVIAQKTGFKESEAITVKVTVAQSVVYVTGFEHRGVGHNAMALYWRNGERVQLSDGIKDERVYGIAAANGDVYMVGKETTKSLSDPPTSRAKYWKNKTTVVYLSKDGGNAAAHAIALVGNDVYAAGYEYDGSLALARVWKNGTPIPFDQNSKVGVINALYVAGNDVYAAGYEEVSTTGWKAKYWKNGVAVSLTTGSSFDFLSSISVTPGGVIYAAGSEAYKGKYWANGVPATLGNGWVKALCFNNTDFYLAGTEKVSGLKYRAWYRKNSVIHYLTDGTFYDAFANAIAIDGSDVHIAGTYTASNGNYVVRYWKNDGSGRILTDEGYSGDATAVLVAKE